MWNFTCFPPLLPHFPHHCSDVFFSLLPSNIFFIAALRRFISSKMAVTLEILPVEVQHKIVGIVNSTTDLHSLCLVSKKISAASATYLYRDFNFPFMTPDAAERFCITLANSNGLLPLVETFRLGMCLRFCSESLESTFLTLLSAFPNAYLCQFHLNGHTLRPSRQDFLWCHQQKIHDLELVIVSKEILRRRRINKNSLPDNGMIHELEKLEKLGLAKRLGPKPNSSRVHSSIVSSKHQESAIRGHRRVPLTNMKQLSLDNITLKGHFLDSLPHLSHLAFPDCSAAGQCLVGFHHQVLKALFFFYDPYERNVLLNLSNILSRIQGLETLSVRDIWRYKPSARNSLGRCCWEPLPERRKKPSVSFMCIWTIGSIAILSILTPLLTLPRNAWSLPSLDCLCPRDDYICSAWESSTCFRPW